MPGGLLADHAGAQHQAVRDDLRFLRVFLQDGHEKAGQAHGWVPELMNFALSSDSGEITLSETALRETGSAKNATPFRWAHIVSRR